MIRRCILTLIISLILLCPVSAQALVHVSVRSDVAVTIRNPSGREWTVAPNPAGYAVLSVIYSPGEWRLSAGCQRIEGPGRWDGCGLWVTLPTSGGVSSWVVVAPTPTAGPAATGTPIVTPSATATPHDALEGIRLPPAPPGHVWVLVVIERGDGSRMVASKALVAVEDLRGFVD